MQPKKPALLPSWPPDNPPTLKQMERDMMAWSAMRHQVEAIQYEGRMIEFRRASDAFEAVLARVAALEEGLKSECTRAEKASHLLDTAEQRCCQQCGVQPHAGGARSRNGAKSVPGSASNVTLRGLPLRSRALDAYAAATSAALRWLESLLSAWHSAARRRC